MEKTIITTGKTIELAIEAALAQLHSWDNLPPTHLMPIQCSLLPSVKFPTFTSGNALSSSLYQAVIQTWRGTDLPKEMVGSAQRQTYKQGSEAMQRVL